MRKDAHRQVTAHVVPLKAVPQENQDRFSPKAQKFAAPYSEALIPKEMSDAHQQVRKFVVHPNAVLIPKEMSDVHPLQEVQRDSEVSKDPKE